jgi:hypothetical protein
VSTSGLLSNLVGRQFIYDPSSDLPGTDHTYRVTTVNKPGLTGGATVPGMSLPDAEAVRELIVAHEGLHSQFLDASLSTKHFDDDHQGLYNNAAEDLLHSKE